MLIPLGFLDFPTAAAGSFDLLQTYTLASSQASVTFSSLGDYAATYQHLQIRWVSRSTASSGGVVLTQFNADTASNYSTHYLVGVPGTGVVSGAVTSTGSMYAGQQAIATANTGAFGAGVIDLLDPFETTKYTTLRGLSGDSASQRIILTSGNWRNTAALTSVKLYADAGGSLAQYSRFSLYGLRKAA